MRVAWFHINKEKSLSLPQIRVPPESPDSSFNVLFRQVGLDVHEQRFIAFWVGDEFKSGLDILAKVRNHTLPGFTQDRYKLRVFREERRNLVRGEHRVGTIQAVEVLRR